MIPINEILAKVNHQKYFGNPNALVGNPIVFADKNDDATALMWFSDKNIEIIKRVRKGTVICSDLFLDFNKDCNYIITDKPRLTFQEVLKNFYIEEEAVYISKTALIDPSVSIGKDVKIGNFVTIEKNCSIGNSVKIDHNTIIKKSTVIEDNVTIGCNCTIGGVGFGYELNAENNYEVLPHIGNVILKRNVEIGNNTCIDRAVLGSTVIDENAKIDNLVHIAHGVKIGKNSLIIANAMIAGSTIIGDNVWVAPSASVLNKRAVADNSYIGMGAVVIKDVGSNETIIGNPGRVLVKSKNKS